MYGQSLSRCLQDLLRAPWVLILPLGLGMLIQVAFGLVAGLPSPLPGFAMALLMSAIEAALLYVSAELVSGSPLRLSEIPQSFKRYFWPVSNLWFVFWVAELLLGPMFTAMPNGHAIQTALGGYQSINDLVLPGGRLLAQRDITVEKLNAIPGVSCVKPKGALYAFPRLDPAVYPIADDEKQLETTEAELEFAMLRVPNLPSPDAPEGKGEADNVIRRYENYDAKFFEAKIKNAKASNPDTSMPAYEETIKGKDLSNLVAYLKTLK